MSPIVDGESVAEGAFDFPAEGSSLEGAPVAVALNFVRGQCPRDVRSHEDEVSHVAFAEIASVFDGKKVGGVVAHQFDELGNVKNTGIHQAEHGKE